MRRQGSRIARRLGISVVALLADGDAGLSRALPWTRFSFGPGMHSRRWFALLRLRRAMANKAPGGLSTRLAPALVERVHELAQKIRRHVAAPETGAPHNRR